MAHSASITIPDAYAVVNDAGEIVDVIHGFVAAEREADARTRESTSLHTIIPGTLRVVEEFTPMPKDAA